MMEEGERKRKEERRDVMEMNWCFIFSYDSRRDSRRDGPDNLNFLLF